MFKKVLLFNMINVIDEGFHSLQGTVNLNCRGKILSLSLVAGVHSIYILVFRVEIVGVTH